MAVAGRVRNRVVFAKSAQSGGRLSIREPTTLMGLGDAAMRAPLSQSAQQAAPTAAASMALCRSCYDLRASQKMIFAA